MAAEEVRFSRDELRELNTAVRAFTTQGLRPPQRALDMTGVEAPPR